ncbi:hypothetical protein SNE40_016419 [Patella caerulea]|uniref:PLAT domain-containing protein n=1 Tax=Patella caerulea TaxID=87958 RepID=A0AAN8PJ01_PATCE
MTGKSDILIYVATGDKKNAGTDANVTIILHDEAGNFTEKIVLDKFLRNDFERGQNDMFKVSRSKLGSLVGKVVKIELWRDDAGLASDWFVDSIVVVHTSTKHQSVFPILRWIKARFRYKIKHFDTSLPQFDEYLEQREMELRDKKKLYKFAQKAPGMPIQVRLGLFCHFG